MGKQGIRIEKNRVRLADQIPLSTPMSVTIVPCSWCTFSCTFCPCRVKTNRAMMPFLMFARIIDEANFPEPVKMLHLYNVGEPLMNRWLPKFVSYAKKAGFSEKISTVTNASMLTRERADRLIDSGIDRIIVSLYGMNDLDYLKNTGKAIGFEQIYANIRYLNQIKGDCEVFVKVINRAVNTPDKLDRFVEMFEDNCTYYSIEPILPIWPNFKPEGGKVDKGLYEGVPARDHVACHYPFYSMVVNARGKVNPCLADWNETVELGDATVDSLNDIWNSAAYQAFRVVQLGGGRMSHHLCATCGTLKAATAPEDDIDSDRERLLNILRKEVV